MEVPATAREVSPSAVATPPPLHNSKKRKHAALAHAAVSSPVPSDPGAGTPAPENLVLSSRHADLASRPRLSISRHPGFVPVVPGSQFYTTEPLCFNRLNFRYTPAGVTSPENAIPFRTIESHPTHFRVSWEDRSPFIRVTQDGLRLQGEKGFRSARCNAPMREGRWYMEVKIELGSGDKPTGMKRKEGSHVRLGWARREAPLNAPAGYDGYSYAVRDKTGEKVHLSRPRPYGRAFQTGDVVGMYICLPPRRKPDKRDPYDPAHIKRERIAIEYKGQEYFESLEYPQTKEMIALMDASDRSKATDAKSLPSSSTKKSATVKNLPSTGRGKGAPQETTPMRPLPTLGPESYIAFFINGECQGIAFQDLYDYLPLRRPPSKAEQKKRANKEGIREHKENPFDDGTLGYYPFVSLFNGAQVQMNPGPDFSFPPPPDIDAVVANPAEVDIKPQPDSRPTWRPVCERYSEFMQEQWALDEQEEKEAPRHHVDAEEEHAKHEKAEQQKAKRKAQAAARRERKTAQKPHDTSSNKRVKTAEQSPAPTLGVFPRNDPAVAEDERYAPAMIIPSFDTPDVHDAATPGSERIPSPAPTATSSLDAQIAGLAGYHDNSAYNTDYEDVEPTQHDGGVETDGDVDIAEVDPIEDAVSYSYGVRR
ncbi:hypothetical protein BD311DRAFT_788095 [Dichomitus squalens]|uniref:B30.2/SPRY domain-containing protein n=1 Tax=Dichomitus squalens TaxID=114155 RepID=A0A4Q9MNJ1_9APHY|nr:hypothetical protein BD311DRAFT_788095 [Dichomitus squalens]